MTSSNGNIFYVTSHLCGEFTGVPGEFPAQRPVTRGFDVFFDLRMNKRLSKQSWGWWFETLSHPLWRRCNDYREWRFCATAGAFLWLTSMCLHALSWQHTTCTFVITCCRTQICLQFHLPMTVLITYIALSYCKTNLVHLAYVAVPYFD